jgi:AMP-binding enzyme
MNSQAGYGAGTVLRRADERGGSRLDRFCAFVAGRGGLRFASYEDRWQWSVGRSGEFWQDIWDFFEVKHDGSYAHVVSDGPMWSKRWFPGARLNYAEHALSRAGSGTAIYGRSHTRGASELSWDELRADVAQCAGGLKALGVQRGDRIAAYLPNIPEAVVAFLASASIGAVWCSCSPEFGPRAFTDRVAQLEPKVLLAVVATGHPSEKLAADLRARIRSQVSPRHVPDEFLWVAALPRTLTGKRLEVPIKRIFQGERASAVLEASAVSNPDSLPRLERTAATRLAAPRQFHDVTVAAAARSPLEGGNTT